METEKKKATKKTTAKKAAPKKETVKKETAKKETVKAAEGKAVKTAKTAAKKPAAKAAAKTPAKTTAAKPKAPAAKTSAKAPVKASVAKAKAPAAKKTAKKPAPLKLPKLSAMMTRAEKEAGTYKAAAKPAAKSAAKKKTSKAKAAKAQNTPTLADVILKAEPLKATAYRMPKEESPEAADAKKAKGKIKVLFASFESVPFTVTGGLGEVAGSLPKAVNGTEFEVRVILPKLKQIADEYVEQMKFIASFYVPLGWRNEYCGLFRLKRDGVTYYFLDNEKYFCRNNIYGEFDDGERTAFYSKAVLESLQYIPNFFPDILHANDWHAALIPVFLREHYQGIDAYRNIKTIFTIHNLKFQGKYSASVIGDICGLAGSPAEKQMISGKDTANYLQGAAIYSDWVSTVSPNYADEICMEYYGEGLDWLFKKRRGNSLSGILNGIDTVAYNPADDPYIAKEFDAKNLDAKVEDKLALQAELGFDQNPDIPLFVLISRLTEQKGLDLLTYNLPKVVECEMQLAVLGVGDYNYEEAFGWYGHNYPHKIAFRREFNTALSHKMYAGADAVLIPSRFEPCGLTQMIAMRYGALPIIRETGGLKDSVVAYYVFGAETDENGATRYIDNIDIANGFSFENFNAGDFMNSIYNALSMWYNDKNSWKKMQKNALKADFSWKQSAKEYRKLYKMILGR